MRVLVWQRKYQNAEIPSGKRKHGLAAQETPESSWVLCFLLQRALPWSHWRFCSCLNVLCEQLSHWYLFRFAVLVVFPSPFKAQLSIKLPHLVNCSSSLSGCANQRSNFAFLFPEGDAEGKIDHSFVMKSVNSIKPRFSALSWGEGEMLSRCPSSPALSVKPHLQSIAGLYGFSLFPELVWILVWGSRMFLFFFFLFFWVRPHRRCALYGQSWMECGESHPLMSCSMREPMAVSLPVGCVWHSAEVVSPWGCHIFQKGEIWKSYDHSCFVMFANNLENEDRI